MKLLLAPLLLATQSSPFTTATPEEAGFDPEALATLVGELERGVHGVVDHFVLIQSGQRVIDEAFTPSHDKVLIDQSATSPPEMYDYANQDWHPYRIDSSLHTLQSVTKSVTSIAVGLAIAEGKITGVDAPVLTWLKDRDVNPDPRWRAMTLEDLLTMRSGIDWSMPPGATDYASSHPTVVMESEENWVPFIVGRPLSSDPGTTWEYCDGASVLIGEILFRATGERVDRYLEKRLFEPLGIREYHWKTTPAGEVDTEGGLYLTAEGLARIGWLYLQEGRWMGKQLLPKDWVATSVAPHVPELEGDPTSGYGYQWWVTEHREGETAIFAARGFGGQFLVASPETETLAVFLGWDMPAPTYELLRSRILPALE